MVPPTDPTMRYRGITTEKRCPLRKNLLAPYLPCAIGCEQPEKAALYWLVAEPTSQRRLRRAGDKLEVNPQAQLHLPGSVWSQGIGP